MFTLPNLPTENLYKFLALGGIITIVSTAFYFISENRKASVNAVKIHSLVKMYNLKMDKFGYNVKIVSSEYKRDSIRFGRQLQKVRESREYNRIHKGPGFVYTMISGKVYSSAGYEQYLIDRLDSAAELYNRGIAKEYEDSKDSGLDKIKLEEQQELLDVNGNYITMITIESLFVFVIGTSFMLYGFKKWHEAQEISDELGRIQLKKAMREKDSSSSNQE